MPALDTPFWRFSVAFYDRPGVAAACLDLQDRRGGDVNLLLYALWRGLEGQALDPVALDGLEALTAPWREAAVLPLRQMRRALKRGIGAVAASDGDALRAQIAAAELLAEQIEQALLFDRSPQTAPSLRQNPTLALANARLYLARLPGPDPIPDAESLTALGAALQTDS